VYYFWHKTFCGRHSCDFNMYNNTNLFTYLVQNEIACDEVWIVDRPADSACILCDPDINCEFRQHPNGMNNTLASASNIYFRKLMWRQRALKVIQLSTPISRLRLRSRTWPAAGVALWWSCMTIHWTPGVSPCTAPGPQLPCWPCRLQPADISEVTELKIEHKSMDYGHFVYETVRLHLGQFANCTVRL